MKIRYLILLALGLTFVACNKNSDITHVNESPIQITEYFEFTLNGTTYSLPEFQAWIEDHDTVTVTQIENVGLGLPVGVPEVIYNIHGTGEGTFEVADFTIRLDEERNDPHFFACRSCEITSIIEYFGSEGDFVIGTFSGEVTENDTEDKYPISGKFSAIREN